MRGLGLAMILALVIACGGETLPSGRNVPVSLVASEGPVPGTLDVLASRSVAQLKAMICVAQGCEPAGCPTVPAEHATCWPSIIQDSSHLYIAFSGPAAPKLSLSASLRDDTLTILDSPSGVGGGGGPSPLLSVAAVPVSALPTTIVTVVVPPSDKAPFYSRAIVDLSVPSQGLSADLEFQKLHEAVLLAATDANSHVNGSDTTFWAVDALGVMSWSNASLGCPVPAGTAGISAVGYILFLVKGQSLGVPELEYHTDGTHTIFCGFSRK